MIYCDRCGVLMNREDWEGWLVGPVFLEHNWSFLARNNEKLICLNCLHDDPQYKSYREQQNASRKRGF